MKQILVLFSLVFLSLPVIANPFSKFVGSYKVKNIGPYTQTNDGCERLNLSDLAQYKIFNRHGVYYSKIISSENDLSSDNINLREHEYSLEGFVRKSTVSGDDSSAIYERTESNFGEYKQTFVMAIRKIDGEYKLSINYVHRKGWDNYYSIKSACDFNNIELARE